MTNDYLTIRDIARIVQRYRVMIAVIIFAVTIVGTVVYATRPVTYTATLLVDIVRMQTQLDNLESEKSETQIVQNSAQLENAIYQYDGYYRLKADEQMGETVMNWLKTPRVTSDIVGLAVAQMKQSKLPSIDLRPVKLRKFFTPHRISPQSVQVVYKVSKREQADEISKSLVAYINTRIKLLSGDDFAQFGVRADTPITSNAAKPLWLIALLFASIGAFIAFWSVLVRYSLSKN
jgi:hypothetical protein